MSDELKTLAELQEYANAYEDNAVTGVMKKREFHTACRNTNFAELAERVERAERFSAAVEGELAATSDELRRRSSLEHLVRKMISEGWVHNRKGVALDTATFGDALDHLEEEVDELKYAINR